MRDQARVVVIGGGIVGCSVLYHLARMGWSDVMLVEKTELTAGSTWHAAGLLPLFNMSYSVGQLHKYSIDLYQRLERETGQAVGFHKTGNLRLATNRERMDEYRHYCGTANTIGVPFELVGPGEIAALWPLVNMEGLVGALFHPHDGHVAPVDVTQALAKGARDRGAEVNRQTEVVAIERSRAGEWLVRTGRGDITCETVVTATGSWARQVGAMVGLDLPTIPVEHQYLVTDTIPELVERRERGLPELPVLRESDASYYMREERQGLILGPYEKDAPAWAVDGVPADFGQELLPPDVDRLEPHIEAAMKRVPIFAGAGIKDCVNGPIPYTPDGNPLIGPAHGLPNFWLAEGFSFGITAAGGAGWQLAGWIVEGEPGIDMLAVDPRRFGAYANKHYTRAKNEEAYAHVFVIHYPDEERPAARPARTSPCHDRLAARGAVWGQRYGWERPNWFAPEGMEPRDRWSFRRSNYFEPVGAECRAVRERAGLIDITSFAKFAVEGPGAEAALDRVLANRLPGKTGRIKLAHVLTGGGGVRSEFTVLRRGPERFYLVSSGAAECYDHDFLLRAVAGRGVGQEAGEGARADVEVRNITTAFGVLVLAGPRARDILSAVTDADLSNDAFPWLTARPIEIGPAPALAMRVNFVGELGWELHHPIEYQNQIFDAIAGAGAAHGLAMCGMRAMDSLRIEKSYRMWGQDLTREYSAFEAGLERFVALDKGDFTGRDALAAQREAGIPQAFVTLAVDAEDADPWGNEPIYCEGAMVGRATSGAFGHGIGASLALGYVARAHAEPGRELEIEILGARRPARVVPASPVDPANERLRA